MARPVYSTRLWSFQAGQSSGPFIGPIVPVGFVWVVRDVRMVNVLVNSVGGSVDPLGIETATGIPIAETPVYYSIVGVLYQWQGRAVLNTGEQLQANTNSISWNFVVDGYQLTLP